MANKQIFVNLAVKNLDKSKAFFAALGYTFNPKFTDANAACMVIQEDSIYAMLLVEDFFKTFTSKRIADTAQSTEVLLCLSCDSRAEVDAWWPRRWPPGAPHRARRRTTASCTATASRTSTATSGS